MKPNMKKKFDFSAEMSEAEAIKATPKNEYLEEEKQLLDINAKELVSLNDNVYKLRTEVENLSDSIHECKPIISEEIQKLAVEFGATLLYNFLSQIESKCKEAERRIKKASNAIPIPDTAFYILITIVVAPVSYTHLFLFYKSESNATLNGIFNCIRQEIEQYLRHPIPICRNPNFF